jgi:hypothetical protein
VLKAAQLATFEPGHDADKMIHQRHFVRGMEDVIGAQSVMMQSLYEGKEALPAAQPTATERSLFLLAGAALITAIAALAVALFA